MDKTGKPDDFQVVDRRKVTEAGGIRDEAATRDEAIDPSLGTVEKDDTTSHNLPAVDFHFILNNLAMPALAFLGDVPDPSTGQTQPNLPVAKLFIDSLAVLREKTRGNLTAEEESLLSRLLADLQLRFVEKSDSGTRRS